MIMMMIKERIIKEHMLLNPVINHNHPLKVRQSQQTLDHWVIWGRNIELIEQH